MEDGLTIISKRELSDLYRIKSRRNAGWLVALVLGVFAVCSFGCWRNAQAYIVASEQERNAMAKLQISMTQEQVRMKALLDSQTITGKLLASWGQLVMDRAELAGVNAHPGDQSKTGVANK